MKCSAFARTGYYHKAYCISCEDYYSIIEEDNLSILVICDGAGNKKGGAIAAKLVSEIVVKYLYENFEKLYFMNSKDAKRRIVQKIDHCLREYSKTEGIIEKELACTIIAIAIDNNQRCLCLHLGDGIVLHYKHHQMIPRVISSSMNGLHTKFTFLTVNCDLNQYLQFYRWKESASGTFLLMTDGAQEHFMKLQDVSRESFSDGVKKLDELQTYLDDCFPIDDYSCGIICYNNEE